MRTTGFIAISALLLLAPTAQAQERIQTGQTVDRDLRPGDDKLPSGEFFDAYTFSGEAGDEVTVRMTSPDFDTYLIVTGPGDFNEQNDDVSADDTSSTLTLRLPATGTYRIGATSYEPGESGAYALQLRRGSAPPARTAQPAGGGALRPGQTVEGSLARGDETLSSGEYADIWTVSARRGDTYTVRLGSSAFDTYLMARGPGGLREDNDDDSARGSTDSLLAVTAAADGEIQIYATSYEPGETGPYSLTLEAGATPPPAPPATRLEADRAIALGDALDGELGSGSQQLAGGEYVAVFAFDGRQGQSLDLTMTSADFDVFLQVEGPGGFSAFNDDDPESGGTDSRLIVTLPADGAYQVWATSYEAGERGRYRLSVRDGGAYQPRARISAAPRGGGLIRIGDTAEGALQPGDQTLASGEYVDTFRFHGERGQRVAVELTSSAFDAYIMLTSPAGEQVDADDSGDSTDSRLETALAETGEYEVGVTSYSPGETGSYRFSVLPSLGSTRQAPVQSGARVYAVMVGVSDYGGAQSDLAYTDEDALKLAETLSGAGVLNPASITLTNAEATVGGVRAAFREIAQRAGPDDMFLFFFSGHGGQTETDSGAFSVVEPDGRGESIVLRDGEITDTELADLFATLRTRLSVLVLDSCFSGGFARNVVDRPGRMGLFSSEEDLTSAVADKFQAGGYLSHFLRTGMAGAADADGDLMVTAGELATYLRRQFTAEVANVQAETLDGQRNYQNLVIDRGGVQVDDVIVRLTAAAPAQIADNAKGL